MLWISYFENWEWTILPSHDAEQEISIWPSALLAVINTTNPLSISLKQSTVCPALTWHPLSRKKGRRPLSRLQAAEPRGNHRILVTIWGFDSSKQVVRCLLLNQEPRVFRNKWYWMKDMFTAFQGHLPCLWGSSAFWTVPFSIKDPHSCSLSSCMEVLSWHLSLLMHAPMTEVGKHADSPFLFIILCRLPACSNMLPMEVPNSSSTVQ